MNRKSFTILLALISLVTAAPTGTPIEPQVMQARLGKGFDVSWVEYKKNIEAYSSAQVIAMKEKGFSTARIRTKLPANDTLFSILDPVLQDCFDNGIIPILAYNAAVYEDDPTPENLQKDKAWWQAVADYYQDYPYELLFNLNIEWSNTIGKDADAVNAWYDSITPGIRATNPDRIILYSPKKLSNSAYLKDMVIPTSAGHYVMAEFHSYAAGPSPDSLSDNGHQNPKYWTTGTEYQKGLVQNLISTGRDWQDSTGIYTWFGAWMAGNVNHGNTYDAQAQAVFAEYFVHVLDSLEIPWAINTLDMYYDIDNDVWIDSMVPVLNALRGDTTISSVDIEPMIQPLVSGAASFHIVDGIVEGAQHATIILYSAAGRQIAHGEGSLVLPSSRGVYLLEISTLTGYSLQKLRVH